MKRRMRLSPEWRGLMETSFSALVALLALCVLFSLPAFAQQTALPPKVASVDVDAYVARHRPTKPGTRTLLPPQFIGFAATPDAPPRKAKTDYLKTAQGVLQVTEAPPVNHQARLVTPGGKPLYVYVEDRLVPQLAAAERREALFVGYHLYTTGQGPAIVLTGYAPKKP